MQETRGSRILDYFYDANGQAIAVRYKSNANAAGTYYYYAYNWRGDIVGLYAENGAPECTYTYDAWGKLLSVKNPAGTEMTSATYIGNLQSLKYRGYVYDRETGLYYLQSRYYDPVTRRFINADGLVSTGTGVLGYNMFAYCNNNPIIFSDASGCDPFGILRLIDYAIIHLLVQVMIAETMGWEIEVGVYSKVEIDEKETEKYGRLDLYDRKTNSFYEVKSLDYVNSNKGSIATKDQIDRYKKTIRFAKGNFYQPIHAGNATIKGSFRYGDYIINFNDRYDIKEGLIVYSKTPIIKPREELNPSRDVVRDLYVSCTPIIPICIPIGFGAGGLPGFAGGYNILCAQVK